MSYPESDPIPGEVYVWANSVGQLVGVDAYLILSFDSKSGDLQWYNAVNLSEGCEMLISFLIARHNPNQGNWKSV
jgi:hypothetical protein